MFLLFHRSLSLLLNQMELCIPILFFLLIKLLLLLQLPQSSGSQLLPIVDEVLGRHNTQVYIIDVERHEKHELLSDSDLESFHRSFLPNSTLDSGKPRLVYSYRHVLSGFAARLTPGELEAVKSKAGFLYAQPDRHYHLATTYTPKYLGLTAYNAWGSSMMGQGLIIGVIDTGIKARHPSFKDTNMPPPPPPTKWKGNCSYPGFPCNNKIIGAKAFHGGLNPSPEDTWGHGTHVASIAAGNFVKDANVLGMAKGVASGMAPMAHLSIYKVCFPGCDGSDTYAAIDQAIKDGVDIISMSIGGAHTATLYDDSISKGSMAAIQHGIIPVAAAGNDGPSTGTLSHSAPWVLTVGASTTDRRIASAVELGDGRTFLGESAYQPKNWNSNNKWQLEYPGKNGDEKARCCLPREVANLNLRGKIVICEGREACKVTDEEKGEAAYKAGAEGMILLNQPSKGHTTYARVHALPAANIDHPDRLEILDYYLKNQPNATATIRFKGTQFGFTPSPAVAAFSSRGPSLMNGGIIKPDVLAPGVNILAAWPTDVGPNPNPLATHTFDFDYGTSMATPHVSGIVALVRSKHRGWTPQEIISAIVTTANDSWTAAGDLIADDHSYKTAGIYATGAGQVNPTKAMDPGLVFGLTLNDYVGYLCGLGYKDGEVSFTIGKLTTCKGVRYLTAGELNYPSIAVNLTRSVTSQTVSRTVKNVGNEREEYLAKITEPVGVTIYLSSYSLRFTRLDQEESYNIQYALKGAYPSQGSDMIRRGKIVWDSGKHVVTTPIAVTFT